LRSRIVLACAEDADNRAVAKRFGVTDQMVGKWRFRFVGRRLDGLIDAPRPGAPPKVTDDQIERLVAKTIEEKPAGGRPWSTRSMAQATGLSHSTVLRIWNAHGIRPERSRRRRLSIQRVGQIVPLYPSRRARP
jgi:transposase